MPNTFAQNLGRLGQQLLSVWKQLGLNQRISIVVTGLAVLVGLSSLAYWSGRPSLVLLYGGLDATQAGKIATALEESKIPYQIGQNGSSILVASDQVHKVRMDLASKGILKGEGVGFEILDRPNFGISDFVQRANYIRAVQGELARTISQLDDVESARVMITMPENRLLADKTVKPTASVFLLLRGNGSLAVSVVDAIRFLVANSVEGLAAKNVVVTDSRGGSFNSGDEDDTLTGQSTGQLKARRELEQYLVQKAESMLERVLGPGKAVVQVAAELNWDTTSSTEEKFDPESQVLRSSTLDDETMDSLNGEPSEQVAGTSSNTSTETNTVAGVTNTSKTRKKRTNSQYEINKTVKTLAQSAGGIKRLSAAVFIAAKHEGTGAERQVVERQPEEIAQLRRIVMSALGIEDTGALEDGPVTLVEMPFNDEVAELLSKQLEQDSRLQFYWDVGRNVLFGLLGLGVLVAFWRLLNRPAETDFLVGAPIPASTAQSQGAPGTDGGSSLPLHFPPRRKEPGQGVVTVDMLNQLIRENPEGVTQAVRSWLTRGSNVNN